MPTLRSRLLARAAPVWAKWRSVLRGPQSEEVIANILLLTVFFFVAVSLLFNGEPPRGQHSAVATQESDPIGLEGERP